MFTGIVTDTTDVVSHKKDAQNLRLVFKRPPSWNDLELGESIATDGVCLTVAEMNADTYTCDLIPETLAVSTFGVSIPPKVNLERSLKLQDRLSGHLVQGHVDATTQVTAVSSKSEYTISFALAAEDAPYVAYKGSVTINGVALTVAKVTAQSFSVALVPYTLEHTTLSTLKVGDTVNVEFDIIGKYVARTMETNNAKG